MVAPPIDFLNSFFWQFTTIIVAIVAVIGFLVYRYYLEPPISRQFASARWSKGPVGFIQDDANQVHLVTSQAALPEGVIYTKRGFFLQSRAPYIPPQPVNKQESPINKTQLAINLKANNPDVANEIIMKMADEQYKLMVQMEKRKPGRPKGEDSNKLSEEQVAGLSCALQTPTLAGFGRAVFFGYDGAPLVSNLKTLALTTDNAVKVDTELSLGGVIKKCISKYVGYADLRVMKEIIPATISRTQLGNLYKWSVQKGYEKRGGESTKLLMIVIIACIPIACLGIVAFLLLNSGK
jgi:hypothetical protein